MYPASMGLHLETGSRSLALFFKHDRDKSGPYTQPDKAIGKDVSYEGSQMHAKQKRSVLITKIFSDLVFVCIIIVIYK